MQSLAALAMIVAFFTLAFVVSIVADSIKSSDDLSLRAVVIMLVVGSLSVVTVIWSSAVFTGHHVRPDAVSWRAPATLDEARTLMKEHADYIQHTRDGSNWMLSGPAQVPGHYTGIGHVKETGQMCLYVTPSGVFVGNDYYDGSRYSKSTGPCHDQVPTSDVYKLGTDGSWSAVGSS